MPYLQRYIPSRQQLEEADAWVLFKAQEHGCSALSHRHPPCQHTTELESKNHRFIKVGKHLLDHLIQPSTDTQNPLLSTELTLSPASCRQMQSINQANNASLWTASLGPKWFSLEPAKRAFILSETSEGMQAVHDLLIDLPVWSTCDKGIAGVQQCRGI